MDDLECQNFIQIYREKITETIDLSSPSFLDASVKTFTNIIYIKFSLVVDVIFLLAFTRFGHIQSKNQVAMLEVIIWRRKG